MKLSCIAATLSVLYGISVCCAFAQFASSGSKGAHSSGGSTAPGGFTLGVPTPVQSNIAGGVKSSLGIPAGTAPVSPLGFTNLYNLPGQAYFSASPYSQQFPRYASIGGTVTTYGSLSARNGYWLSPSGFYYPFYPNTYQPGSQPTTSQIYQMQSGVLNAAKPPVAGIISDMRQFIEDAKGKRQLDQSNYEYATNRLNTIEQESGNLAAKNGGNLDTQDEVQVRQELDLLSADIARAVNP